MKKLLFIILLITSSITNAQVAKFEVVDLNEPTVSEKSINSNPCDNIGEMKSKFNSKRSYFTSVGTPISIEKHINNGSTVYYLSIMHYDSYLSYPSSRAEISVLFSDGTLIKKIDDDIDIDYSSYERKYQYHSFVTITSAEAKLLASKLITDYKVYIYESEFDTEAAKKFLIEAKCVLDKK